MKRIRKATLLPAVIVALALMMAGCSRPAGEQAAEGGRAPAAAQGAGQNPGGPAGGPGGGPQRVMTVETVTAEIRLIELVKQYVGEIKPFFSVDLRSTASGWLTSISVDIGDRVSKNSVICVIEHDDIQAQAAQSEANVSVANATVARAEAELEKVLLEIRRAESLYEKGYISKREIEQAQTAEKQARASLDAAKGQLEQAQAQLKNVEVKLRDATVKAPFAGVVAERYVDPGAYVSPANPILRLVDDTRVKAVVNVLEEDVPRLTEGSAAVISSDSFPGRGFAGKIIRISPAIDGSSRTAAVEILIPNGDGSLRSGMTARAALVVSRNPAALVIPENALRRDVEAGIDFVFAVVDGVAARRDVKTGIISNGDIEIAEGLNPGDIVITGNVRISDGMKVEPAGEKGGPR